MTKEEDEAKLIVEHTECLEQATFLAKTLNRDVFVQKMVPDRPQGFLHPKWVIFFETDAWIGGHCVRPDGGIYECEEYT